MSIFLDKLPVHAANGGYFKSRGQGTHPVRTINSYELIFVENGTLKIYETDSVFTLNRNDCLVLYPGREHGGLNQYPPDLRFYWLHFQVENSCLKEFMTEIQQCTHLLSPDKIKIWFRRFLNDQETGIATNEQNDLLLALILSELTAASPGGAFNSNILAVKTHDYLKLNFTDDIMVSDVADYLKCNVDYLGRVFKQTYGMTVNQCLNRMRISYSRKLLLESSMNIEEITAACGYNDPTYFRRRFKAETGTTPKKYQNLYGKVHVNTV